MTTSLASSVGIAIDPGEAGRIAVEHLEIVARGDLEAVDGNVTEDFLNHRSAQEPLESRERGPAGLKATIAWLQQAFSDMRFECHDVIVDGDRVAVYAAFHGRQHGPFVVHDSPDGAVTGEFASKGRSFAARHIHFCRIRDGKVAEHDAVRDDAAMAKQLGWIAGD
jgi:ketosteroid isomerase-like protein